MAANRTSTRLAAAKKRKCEKAKSHELDLAHDLAPPSTCQPPDSTTLRDDFAAILGHDHDVEAMLARKEPKVDPFGQIAHGSFARAKEEKARRLEAFMQKVGRRDNRRDSARDRHQVPIKGDNWVLFDPTRGYPPTLESEPPPAFRRFEQYKPGNAKIVAYNLESYAVALKATPRDLDGGTVEYTTAGPKLVKATAGREKAITTVA